MLHLPARTVCDRRIPKQTFYERLALTPALRQAFARQIRGIFWRHKIAPATMDIAPGPSVTELEIFEIEIQDPPLPAALLRLIDQSIPYHILFLFSWDGLCQAWLGYKDTVSGAPKVSRYYHTDWMEEKELPLRLIGRTTDDIYENFLRQIAGSRLADRSAPLKEAVRRDAEREALEKQILSLEKKLRKEQQPNRQYPIFKELQAARRALEALTQHS